MTTNLPIVFAWGLGTQEIIILAVLGVLLFGRRLPEVGRYLGKSIIEFKKGMKGIEEDMSTLESQAQAAPPMEQPRPPQRVQASAPKFQENSTNSGMPAQTPQV